MNELVERLAKTLCALDCERLARTEGRSGLLCSRGRRAGCGDDWQAFEGWAHDVLRAAREPTDAMVAAGRDAANTDGNADLGRIGAAEAAKCWRAMVDEALR